MDAFVNKSSPFQLTPQQKNQGLVKARHSGAKPGEVIFFLDQTKTDGFFSLMYGKPDQLNCGEGMGMDISDRAPWTLAQDMPYDNNPCPWDKKI